MTDLKITREDLVRVYHAQLRHTRDLMSIAIDERMSDDTADYLDAALQLSSSLHRLYVDSFDDDLLDDDTSLVVHIFSEWVRAHELDERACSGYGLIEGHIFENYASDGICSELATLVLQTAGEL